MWVSTGKAGKPKDCDITTEAVLCPTPKAKLVEFKGFENVSVGDLVDVAIFHGK
jgi:hypothetical protein